jgi:hypothetical protein
MQTARIQRATRNRPEFGNILETADEPDERKLKSENGLADAGVRDSKRKPLASKSWFLKELWLGGRESRFAFCV